MKTTSRREFMAATSSAVVAGASGAILSCCANAEGSTVDGRPRATAPSRLYERDKIPRVDTHMHFEMKQLDLVDKYIEIMDAGHIAVSVNLSGTLEMLKQADTIREKWKSRILLCPGDYDPTDGLWWSEKDLADFREKQCAGTKIWAKYRQGVLAHDFEKKVRLQGELGLPVIGFHVADPPEGRFFKPNYWECIREAEKLIQRCPETTFIMAHGFWLMNEDRGLDVLAEYFDLYPNLNVDLCAVYQWWDPPQPSYKKLRDFIIAHKDRLLFGTDGQPNGYTTLERLNRIYRVLESDKNELKGFFRNETNLRGLNLPLDVLNHIYYWNAARLVPEVRRSLEQCGHKLS